MTIITKHEGPRGCGYRKKGGLYFVGGRYGEPCGKLPIELTYCPCCGAGIKFSRGFQWIGSQLIEKVPCSASECKQCPVWSGAIERYGLMWVGEKFYPTPDDFLMEARRMGISKRIATVPKDFVVSKDWILLAHKKAICDIVDGKTEYIAGIFQAFKPTRIEYVVKGDETQEELERMEKRGITLVDVKTMQEEISTS